MNDNDIRNESGVAMPTSEALDALSQVLSEASENAENNVQLSQEEENLLAQALENENTHVEIPVNSESLNIDETTSRFSGAIWYEELQKQIITLAGVGGIGRFGNLINF